MTLTSAMEAIGTRRFDADEEALMLLDDGPEGRRIVDRASAAPTLLAMVSGRHIAVALSDGPSRVAAFRKACGFGLA